MKQTVLILITLLPAVAGIANAQTAEAVTLEEPSGEIGGIVVSSKTGEPLASAAVMLGFNSSRGGGRGQRQRRATTAPDGRFHFAGLAAGRYSVAIDKTGYERRGMFHTSATLRLSEGEARENVRIELRPSAVITGRVLDAHGDPLPGAEVRAYRRSYHPDRNRWSGTGTASSNDLGEYRIYGLAPGKYAVRARPPAETTPPGILYYESAREFYPGVPEADQAALIPVSWGSEIGAVDFELGPAPQTILSGVVLDDKTGNPCKCFVRVTGEDRHGSGEILAGPEGLFSLRGLRPGSYYLSASYPGESRNTRQAVQVSDAPTDDVVLVTTDGQTASGEVVFVDPPEEASEDQASPAGGRAGGLQVVFTGTVANRWSGRTRIPAPRTSGRFEVDGLLDGPYRISLQSLPPGGYLRAVKLGGRWLDSPEVIVPAEGSLSNLQLEVAFDGAVVNGTVKPPEGVEAEELSTAWVMVISEKTDGYQYRGRLRLGADASFTLPEMPPGTYTFYAVPFPETFDLWDPEVRRSLGASGKRLSLSAEDEVTIELPYIPEPAEPM